MHLYRHSETLRYFSQPHHPDQPIETQIPNHENPNPTIPYTSNKITRKKKSPRLSEIPVLYSRLVARDRPLCVQFLFVADAYSETSSITRNATISQQQQQQQQQQKQKQPKRHSLNL
ncbi:uncharacterized protein BO97DRAFT_183856 [Aspergillus homomorphus CBS 101889]|uniref:Uncharacterized protein n=1 Tax=Aspergillus homomorphus (strain CBS 101889) TaxID=1450537 RepID=A0A395I7E0_ASPHC|nr:hypothetical protein BO97DRAFT_183856 [Aspergillus homomorphus CBS 101889]RAL16132.1 hypothetical protein BO97DRAFT_183856 [Aspergillus homomorphus CBS 101889]